MKQVHLLILLFCMAQQTLSAKEGSTRKTSVPNVYHIKLHVQGEPDSMVYLVHYYGEGGSRIYMSDSAMFKNGTAEFRSTDSSFVGGSYMMLQADRRPLLEFLLNRGDDISISAKKSQLPQGITFTNSPENDKFRDYQEHARKYGEEQQALVKELENVKTHEDTADIRKRGGESAKAFADYRKKTISENPNTFLATIIRAMEKPEVPAGDHFLEDGKTKDSTFAYRYYKAHYWDGFDFRDDRMMFAPLYDAMLDEYMNKMVLPITDSVAYECNMLLSKVKGTKHLFHYTLWWLTKNVENSKIMGINDVFVELVENYYMKGDAFWLTSDELKKYVDRAMQMAPNVIGNVAPPLRQQNVFTHKIEDLQSMNAPYTVVVFYSPNCGHCQHEMPLLDSLYEAVLKDKGVKIYTVATEGEEKVIKDFLEKLKIDKKWTNTWDPDQTRAYHNPYDVLTTPTIYILDDKKIIRGKKVDHTNINNVIEITERRKKDQQKDVRVKQVVNHN